MSVVVYFAGLLGCVGFGYGLALRAIKRTEQPVPPACFQSFPSPQAQAENDCEHCPFVRACL